MNVGAHVASELIQFAPHTVLGLAQATKFLAGGGSLASFEAQGQEADVPESPRDLPRVLIVSVNPLSASSNNGKTYASFFEGYPTKKLAQLYFHRELPTSDVCRNYFRISDEDVLRFTSRRIDDLGGPVSATTKADQLLSPATTRRLAASGVVRLLRLFLLSLVIPRRHLRLNEWLDDFRPEIIFFSGGNATYLYPLVERVSKERNAPVATYITDDYVLPTEHGGPVTYVTRAWVRRHFLRMCRSSALVLTIGEKMSRVYADRFGIDSTSIMNLVTVIPDQEPSPSRRKDEAVMLCYAGGLHLNRWDTLARIGVSLDRLAQDGLVAQLHIYTSTELEARMKSALTSSESIVLHDSVGWSELQRIYAEADLLVHVESFAPADRTSTYLSISTKISEYLASGRSILAVGPADVASIEYVTSSDAGFIATGIGEAELDEVLREAVADSELRQHKAKLAQTIARQNHEAEGNRRRLWRDLIGILGPSHLESDSGKEPADG